MMLKKQTSWPVPLRERDIGLGKAVREYADSTEATGDEPAAYDRVLRRLARRPRRAPFLILGFGMGAAAVLATTVMLHRGPGPEKDVALAPAPPTLAPAVPKAVPTPPRSPAPATQTASFRLAASPLVLPAGRVELVGQASAVLSPDAVASGRAHAGRTEIALDKGNIELHVLPRVHGDDFAVRAGDYRFVVVGTSFTVSHTETRLQLVVTEGKVAVWRGSERLTTIGAGKEWSVPLGPAAPSRPQAVPAQGKASSKVALREPLSPAAPALARSPWPALHATASETPTSPPALATAPSPATAPLKPESMPQAAPAVRRDCGVLAGRLPQEAMGCYQQQAAQGGLAGEAAQYEIARLWRDSFHDPARALAAFREQRSRFPRGVLDIEADLSIIELLPRLERHAEALSESERFLKEHPGAERRGEIHLLRGNIYREALRDFNHAEREYARGAEARGRAGDENRFLRAVCLESLGRAQEARKAYEDYLSRPKCAHAAEAKRRLERLGP